MASLDNTILKQRLLLRESAVNYMTVSKIATRIQCLLDDNLIKSSSSTLLDTTTIIENDSNNEIPGVSDKLTRDILTYKLDMAKIKHIYSSCDEEIIAYQELYNDIDNQIITTQNEIKELELELNQQVLIRKHREECETLAIQINTLPNIKKLDNAIQDLAINLSEVREAIVTIDGKIDQRLRQYDILSHAITDMQSKLLVEDEDIPIDTLVEDMEDDVPVGDNIDSRGREREIGIHKKNYDDDESEFIDGDIVEEVIQKDITTVE